jgi:hypothetical protein
LAKCFRFLKGLSFIILSPGKESYNYSIINVLFQLKLNFITIWRIITINVSVKFDFHKTLKVPEFIVEQSNLDGTLLHIEITDQKVIFAASRIKQICESCNLFTMFYNDLDNKEVNLCIMIPSEKLYEKNNIPSVTIIYNCPCSKFTEHSYNGQIRPYSYPDSRS